MNPIALPDTWLPCQGCGAAVSTFVADTLCETCAKARRQEAGEAGLFNTSVPLWEGCRQSFAAEHKVAYVAAGHVIVDGKGIIARFRNDAHAIEVLTQAGWKRQPAINSIVFAP